MKRGTLIRWLAIIASVWGLAAIVTPEEADAHGPHADWVMPAWDCYKMIEGDVAITHDLDLKRWIKWRCVCVNTAQTGQPKWVCWWKVIQVRRALKNITMPTSAARYYPPYVVIRRVQWLAQHADGACYKHYARKAVILVKHK
jgi:hypothetical protein